MSQTGNSERLGEYEEPSGMSLPHLDSSNEDWNKSYRVCIPFFLIIGYEMPQCSQG